MAVVPNGHIPETKTRTCESYYGGVSCPLSAMSVPQIHCPVLTMPLTADHDTSLRRARVVVVLSKRRGRDEVLTSPRRIALHEAIAHQLPLPLPQGLNIVPVLLVLPRHIARAKLR